MQKSNFSFEVKYTRTESPPMLKVLFLGGPDPAEETM
jgi:hypothetical protein